MASPRLSPAHLPICCLLNAFNSLALASLGWDVLATDTHHVIQSVLKANVINNLSSLPPGSGSLQVRELDWFIPPDSWTWHHESIIGSSSQPSPSSSDSLPSLLRPPFDLIISADTVYATELITPFLRALHTLSTLSTSSSRGPPILLCIERRDPILLDRLLSDAKVHWGFHVERISHKKIGKSLQKCGVKWPKSDWDGIEIWKLRLLLTS